MKLTIKEEQKILESNGWRDLNILRNTVTKDGRIESREDAIRIEIGLDRNDKPLTPVR